MWKRWRRRLTYLLMSVVVGWQAFAIVVSPAPDNSEAVQALKGVLEPYSSALRVDNTWGFFAPNISRQTEFRYIIEDAAGKEHRFTPQREPARSLAAYVMWREFRYVYDGVLTEPDDRGDAAGALLCRKHVALHPVSVTLIEIQYKDFWREDAIRGKRPTDPEFVTENPIKRIECPDAPGAARRSPARLARKPS
jgi:hypothetical protein